MEEEKEKPNKKRLDLDWEKLLPSRDNDLPEPEVVVVQSTSTVPAAAEPPKPSPMSIDQQTGASENLEVLTDHELEVRIDRQKRTLESIGHKLADKGEKLRAAVKRLEEENERRKLRRLEKGIDGCEKPRQSENPIIVVAAEGSTQETRSSQGHQQSSFGKEFCRRIDENSNSRRVNSVDKEFSGMRHCDRRKKRSNGQLSSNARQKGRFSSKQRSIQFRSISPNGNRHISSYGDLNGRGSSCSLRRHGESLFNSFLNKQSAFPVTRSKNLRPSENQTVVLVDEEDCQTIEAKEDAEKLTECMKEVKIYYPSRDDPDPVIICYADLDCLAPEAFLTSTIMNFYIRYLQQQAAPTNRAICDYLFFNTYFYEKLKEAVTCKGTDKNTKFVKFRRWWKGVNIFQKAYVLIPINQDLHWSLVIICIPDKEDESGPIILHLDSLGLHSSRSVFDNIKSYMKEEWNCLNQEVASTDLPIADNIWKNLPRRIEEKKIVVPRQKNEYDCGLFVLFFMERFIEDAPERLDKKKDLSMFGRRWFRSEEASELRGKIRDLLKEEFQEEANSSSCVMNASPLSESENAEPTDILA